MTIKILENLLVRYKIDGYIIPTWDEFQSEYPLPERSVLQYLSGFTGSYGIAVIMKGLRILFTDSRYILQAKEELGSLGFEIKNIKDLGKWCSKHSKICLGYDGMMFTKRQLSLFSDINLKCVDSEFIKKFWSKRPKLESKTPFVYSEKFIGISFLKRLEQVRAQMKKVKADYLISTAPECVAWLLAVRGRDQPYLMTFQSRMIVSHNKIMIFSNISEYLLGLQLEEKIECYALDELFGKLKELKGAVIYDATTCPIAIEKQLDHLQVVSSVDPHYLIKACKPASTIQWMVSGHQKDAIVLCEFFSWLEERMFLDDKVTEYEVGKRLSLMRSKQDGYISDSFPTICGFGSNGAIVHYRAPYEGSKVIDHSSLLLVDSGAHYYGCTTDVTRTLHFGIPTLEQIQRYTDVLKGHISLSAMMFPKNITGAHLDVLARQYLWDNGLDYAHGTGHGVGNVLNVHEGPHSISLHSNKVALQEGMISSNEPGYYKDGEWGIRIENLMYIDKSAHKDFLEFFNLTLLPYAPNLIDWSRIASRELAYLKIYYSRIKEGIVPHLSPKAKRWCKKALYLPE